ncbi:serine/threonine-protein kinase [Paractinoplanes durhamensis]|uniref:serine/threonine-protein kinase n=1 Tax=Paractinoplanes durhamensis TaxID=113563 RepID=UPI003626B694
MLSPGAVLSERYELTERIAAGGMGEVWRGTDLLLHRPVAVKVLLEGLAADREFIARFRTEARMMASLRHPGIVQVYDFGESGDGGVDFLVMEFIEGRSLAKRIEAAGKLSATETVAVVGQIAEALQAAHDAGIIHRDVKPSNLLVRPGGALVLVDFGVARSTTGAGLTGTNVVMGSAHYMAPEQAEGKPVTPATDVYALGAVAYTCLTGRPPYIGDNPLQVIAQLIVADPPTLPMDVPPQVAAVVLRALEKDPARRHQSAAAFSAAARVALTGQGPSRRMPVYTQVAAAPMPAPPVSSPPPTSPTIVQAAGPPESPKNRQKGGRKTALAVLAAVVLAAAGVGIAVAVRPDPSPAQGGPPGANRIDAPDFGKGGGPGEQKPIGLPTAGQSTAPVPASAASTRTSAGVLPSATVPGGAEPTATTPMIRPRSRRRRAPPPWRTPTHRAMCAGRRS